MGCGRFAAFTCLAAAFWGSGCGLYDRTLLERAGADAAPYAGTQADARTRKATLSYVMSGSAGTAGQDRERTPHREQPAPAATPHDPPASSQTQAPHDTTATDDDAGMTSDETAAPPMLEERRACGNRPAYFDRRSGHCYVPVRDAVSWYMARDSCRDRRSHLATITSQEEQAFIARLPRSGSTWIGLSKFGTRDFSWITGEALAFTAWQAAAPSASSEAGVLLHETSSNWLDAPPSETHGALCEREPNP